MTSIKKLHMMSITHSTTWLVISADQTFGYTTIYQHFMITNHPIMPNLFPTSNPTSKMIKVTILTVILQLLQFWSFLLVHGFFPFLSYSIKGPLETPYHTTTSPKPSPPYFHCIESAKCLFCLSVLSSHWVPAPSPVPDDLATKILQNFSSKCNPMYTITYPKITARGIPIQLGMWLTWELPFCNLAFF
jgi:hypothetical protein